MRTRIKALLAVLGAVGLLGGLIGTASATRLQMLNAERGIRLVWHLSVFEEAGNIVECPTTLEGTFSTSTIVKRAGTAIGSLTRAMVNAERCWGGGMRVLTETLPWSIQYSSFSGSLPAIISITARLIGAAFLIRATNSLTCLVLTSSTHPAVGIFNLAAGTGTLRRIASLDVERGAGIPLTGEGGLCAFGGEGHFWGNASVTVLGETASLEVALI